jgi:hypothetical protein
MAVSILGSPQSGINFEAGTGLDYTAETDTGGGNRLLCLLWGAVCGGSRTISALTIGATSMTAYAGVNTQFSGNAAHTASAFLKHSSIPAGSNAFALTWSGTDIDKGQGVALTLSGVDQDFSSIAVVGTGVISPGTGVQTFASGSASSYNDGDLIFFHWTTNNASTPSSITGPSGFSDLYTTDNATFYTRAWYQVMSGSGSITPQITANTGNGVPTAIRVTVIPAASGASVAPIVAYYQSMQD